MTTHARNLAIDLTAAFPHAAFKQRATRIPIAIDTSVGTIQSVLGKNGEGTLRDFDALDLIDVKDQDRDKLRAAHTDSKQFANLHPGLGLHEVF